MLIGTVTDEIFKICYTFERASQVSQWFLFPDLVPWITCESSTPVILDGNYGWVEKKKKQQQPSVCSLQGYKVA